MAPVSDYLALVSASTTYQTEQHSSLFAPQFYYYYYYYLQIIARYCINLLPKHAFILLFASYIPLIRLTGP